jgi:HSP20 family protein
MTDKELTTHKKQELTGNEHTRPGRTYVPDVDIYETSDSLWLRADMPGVVEQ